MGDDAYGINREMIDRIVAEIGEVVAARRAGRGRHRRRQHLPRRRAGRGGHGPRDRRLHGHAGDADERARAAGRDAPRRRRVARAVGAVASSRSSSPTSAARRCATSRRARSSSSPPAPAIRSSPPTPPRRCAAARWASTSCSRRPRSTASTPPIRRRTRRRTRYPTLTFDEAIVKNLKVMDATALALCRDQNMLLKVFCIFEPGALKRVVHGRGRRHAGALLRMTRATSNAEEPHDRRHQEDRRAEDGKVGRGAEDDLGKVRTGRAHTGLLDHIQVDYYGTPMPINQVRERHARRRAHDRACSRGRRRWCRWSRRRSAIPTSASIRRPRGDVIRVPMPALTEERRKELTKVVHHEGRERARRRAQHPPRRERAPEEAAEGQASARRTTSGARRTTCRSSPTASSPRSTSCSQRKEADLMAV